MIIQWGDQGNVEYQAVLSGIELAYELLAAEDYRADLAWWAGNAVQVSAAHEDEEGVVKWAKIAATHYAIEAGADSPQVRTLNQLAKEPRRANAWGARTKVEEDITVLDFDSLDNDSPAGESDFEETLVDEAETEDSETPEAEAESD